jgi:hypothetical protein
MSEGRIGGQGLPEEVEGLPEAFGRGNRMRAETGPSEDGGKVQNPPKGTTPVRAARGKPIV